jgi:predicted TIM-barrel fold metal-dependent hydrolase
MEIIDFHVHAGKFTLLRDDIQGLLTKFPFEEDVDVRQIFSEPRILKAYLQRQGVSRAVILAECGPGTNFSIDSELIAEFCADDPFFVPFGSINPNHHTDPVAEWEKDWKLGIRGYKFYPADHDFEAFTPEMMAVYERCNEAAQPIMFHTGLTAQRDASQRFIRPSEYRDLVERFPDMTVIFAHGGKPNWYDEALEMAIRYDNVYLDTALVPIAEASKWFDYHPDIKHKVLFGSDLPVCGGYQKLLSRFSDDSVDREAWELMMNGNAQRVLERAPVPELCEA